MSKNNPLRVPLTRFRLLMEAHILNPVVDGAEKHRLRRYKAFSRILTRFMKRHILPSALSVQESPVIKDRAEKIYTIWFQGETQAPPIVKSCFASIRRHCSQELVVLDENTVFDYISLPEAIVDKYRTGKMKPAHFADICRVELLHTYGGYWLDATCFVTGAIPAFIQEQDFFVYMAGSKVHGNYSYMHLIDKLAGVDVDLLSENSYSLIGMSNDIADRFILRVGKDESGFENANFAWQNGNGVVVNGEGQLQIFDLTGRMIYDQYVSGIETMNVSSMQTGVYIFKLNEKTQKMVVR